MIDKGRIRRGPMLALAGVVGAGALAAGIWAAADSGSSPQVRQVAERNALAHTATPAPVPPAAPARPCASARPSTRTPEPVPPKNARPKEPRSVPSARPRHLPPQTAPRPVPSPTKARPHPTPTKVRPHPTPSECGTAPGAPRPTRTAAPVPVPSASPTGRPAPPGRAVTPSPVPSATRR
ncbi:hypothetical protein [Actinomadura nitritigenes]|uniref:hypothetical protein n=1 Tax=Actinomadura nitritigenes TaxID=134602 RepID=UPI003D8BA7D2